MELSIMLHVRKNPASRQAARKQPFVLGRIRVLLPKREALRHAVGARVCDPQQRGQAEGTTNLPYGSNQRVLLRLTEPRSEDIARIRPLFYMPSIEIRAEKLFDEQEIAKERQNG
jgi:hypothetical protein